MGDTMWWSKQQVAEREKLRKKLLRLKEKDILPVTLEFFIRRFGRHPFSNALDNSYFQEWVSRVRYGRVYSFDDKSVEVMKQVLSEVKRRR